MSGLQESRPPLMVFLRTARLAIMSRTD